MTALIIPSQAKPYKNLGRPIGDDVSCVFKGHNVDGGTPDHIERDIVFHKVFEQE